VDREFLDDDDDIHAPVRTGPSIGGIVGAIGGAVIVVGTLLELLSVTVGRGAAELSASKSYLDTDNGKVVAALGVVVLVIALGSLVARDLGVMVPIAVAAAGLAAFGFALYDRIDLNDGADAVGASFGPALYVAMAGGVLATVGAMLIAREEGS
jgi:hypothetical protein